MLAIALCLTLILLIMQNVTLKETVAALKAATPQPVSPFITKKFNGRRQGNMQKK